MTFASPFSPRYYVDSDGSGVRKLHPSYRVFFFCAENKPELNLAYPPGFSISVNDQFVNLSMVKIKPIVIAPFDITHLINCEGATNTVCLDYVSASKEFVFEVQLLKIVSLDRHIAILKSDFLLTEAQCLQKLRKKDEDLGVTTDMVSLSLVCPISGARICHPGKSKSCEHIQCFDIGNFLTMNLTHPRWLCPICGCQCTYYDIVYDE
jgi:E3 SUMO-protein ligase PIAS1